MKWELEKLQPYLENFRYIADLSIEYLGIDLYPSSNVPLPQQKMRTPSTSGLLLYAVDKQPEPVPMKLYSEDDKIGLERMYLAL